MTGLIILNYNNWEDTLNCVDSVEQYNTAQIKYIVVDNGSKRKGTVEALAQRLSERFGNKYCRKEEGNNAPQTLPYMTLLVSKTNDGYARGNNKGLRLAYGDNQIDYVMILNNDTLFVADIIPGLLEAYPRLDKAALISPLLLKKDKKSIDYNCARKNTTTWRTTYRHLFVYFDPFGLKDKWQRKESLFMCRPSLLKREAVETEILSGACLLAKKHIFEEIDSFDPHTFLYYEEAILHKKTVSKGYKSYVIPKYPCIHLGASSTKHSPTLLTMKASAASAQYYIDTYSGAGSFQKNLFRLVSYITVFQIRLKEAVFKAFKIKGRRERSLT